MGRWIDGWVNLFRQTINPGHIQAEKLVRFVGYSWPDWAISFFYCLNAVLAPPCAFSKVISLKMTYWTNPYLSILDANLTFIPTTTSSERTLIGDNTSHHSEQTHHNQHQHHRYHHFRYDPNTESKVNASSPLSPIIKKSDDESSLPLLPLVPEESLSKFDHSMHPDKNNPKSLQFEEEPADSYIVRSKSAILRCRTLNALNAWFTCNSGSNNWFSFSF